MKKKIMVSFFILASSTAFSKIFSILNRMLLSRILDKEGMGLYMLILPTLGLAMTLAELGIPNAVFRLISSPKYKNRKVIFTSLSLALCTGCIVSLGLLLLSPFLSHTLLKNEDSYLSIISLAILIPLLCINGILKNYYLGMGRVGKLSICQFLEEIARLGFTYFLIIGIPHLSLSHKVMIVYLSMTFEEIIALIFLLVSLKDKVYLLPKMTYQYEENFIFKDILSISIPHTASRLVQSFASFLQPAILTQYLLRLHYDLVFIKESYGILSGYVISLLGTPSFFTSVVYRILLPIISEDVFKKKHKRALVHMLYGELACFLMAVPFTLIFFFFPAQSLHFLYGTIEGADILKYMAIPFMVSYLQTPMSVVLQALNRNQALFCVSLSQCVIETLLLIFLIPYHQVLSVAIAMILSMFFTLVIESYLVYRSLFQNNK